MRKIIVSLNITLDGFIASENLALDWHFRYWNEELAHFATEQLNRADSIIMGRITYEAMKDYWPGKALDLSYPREDICFAEMMNSHTKIVFSRTLDKSGWRNTRFVQGALRKEVESLKMQPGKHIMIYGSCSIVSALMRNKLIDEYILWIHPVVLGKGRSLFASTSQKENLVFKSVRTFRSGVVVLTYKTQYRADEYQNKNYGEIQFKR